VTLKALSADTAGQPRSRRVRAKGIGARLALSAGARVRLDAVSMSYRLGGKTRTARLRTGHLRGGKQLALRLRLRGRHADRLELGTRVTLVVRLRARSDRAGCGYGNARTFRLRTQLIWVSKRSAI
jgi:hypothetical protein